MERTKVEIEIIKNEKGIIFIKFDDGCICPIKNIMENNGILSALEVELKYALKETK
ncbi:MAG: hypothetical protein WDA02_07475 [Saccharofermentanales bacterium]